MMKKYNPILIVLLLSFLPIASYGQTKEEAKNDEKGKKSMELGIGSNILTLSRIKLSDYNSSDQGDKYRIQLRDVMLGGNLYIAKELSQWFYMDIQGTLGYAKVLDYSSMKNENKFFGMVGPGIQFRFTPLFKYKFVEPYLRVGINYFHKGFSTYKSNVLTNHEGNEFSWTHIDKMNTNPNNKRDYFPFSLGFGINSWFNERVGFGIQGEYIAAFYNKTPRFPQVTARLMFRFGGKSKSPAPVVNYVDRDIVKELIKEIPKEVVIEKVITVPAEPSLCELFNNIFFEFDKADITAESAGVLNEIAVILQKNKNKQYLITGFTDAKGDPTYNLTLSRRRAAAVIDALEERNVSLNILKSRGVGEKIAIVSSNETNDVRMGDRKVTIEEVQILSYWEKIPKKDF